MVPFASHLSHKHHDISGTAGRDQPSLSRSHTRNRSRQVHRAIEELNLLGAERTQGERNKHMPKIIRCPYCVERGHLMPMSARNGGIGLFVTAVVISRCPGIQCTNPPAPLYRNRGSANTPNQWSILRKVIGILAIVRRWIVLVMAVQWTAKDAGLNFASHVGRVGVAAVL
jgi:hypothetical protein